MLPYPAFTQRWCGQEHPHHPAASGALLLWGGGGGGGVFQPSVRLACGTRT